MATGGDTAVYCTQIFVTVDFTPATEQTLEAASKQENLRWSFVKALYGNLSATNQAKINYGKEKTSAANFSVWAEISDIIGARGECVRPWLIQISVYNRVQDDAYGHLRNQLVDAIKGALNAYSYSIYDFGTTDTTRQNPNPTASYFYPRIDDEGVLPELGDGVDGYYIRYRCFSVRSDMVGE